MRAKILLAGTLVAMLLVGSRQAVAVQFTGLFQTYSSPTQLASSSLATMNEFGVVAGTRVPTVELADIAVDPNGFAYGCRHQSVYRVDRVTGQATEIVVEGPTIPSPGWPIGITYDSARSRIVLATLEGIGFLYGYSPKAVQWSYISDLSNADLQSIVYRPSNDVFYGFLNGNHLQPFNSIFRYNASGQFLGTTPLQHAIPGTDIGGDRQYQLLLTDTNVLALLTPPVIDPMFPSQPIQKRLYLINPDTGAITYNAPFPAIPEPSTFALMLPVIGAVSRRRGRRDGR